MDNDQDLSKEEKNSSIQPTECLAAPEAGDGVASESMRPLVFDPEHYPDDRLVDRASRKPAELFHVVDFIRDEMDERGWSIWDLVYHMASSEVQEELGRLKLSMEILALREPGVLVGKEGAEQLARAFGTSIDIWLNLDKSWQNAQLGNTSASDGTPSP